MDRRDFAIEAARLLKDRHCENVLLMDVRGLSQVCDYVLIATGTSDKQMRSIADDLKHLGRDHGHPLFRTNQDSANTWILADFIDVVVHLFEPEVRAYYAIEELWSDAKIVPWDQNNAPPADATNAANPAAPATDPDKSDPNQTDDS